MSTGVIDEAHGASGPTLAQFVAAIPPHCRTPSTLRGLACLGAGLLEVALASAFAYITYINQMYILWPVSWLIGSIAFASWFVLGHDCGHFSLVRSKGLQVLVGHGLLAPLLYPFYAWKFSHEAHHRFTNRLWRGGDIAFDNAWMPLTVEQYETERRRAPPLALLYQLARRFPPFGTLLHLPAFQYNLPLFPKKKWPRVITSYLVVVVTAGSLLVGLRLAFGSWLAPLHLWLVPAMLFQVWMGFYTYVHHTAEDVGYHSERAWGPFLGRVRCTLNCLLPRWLSALHFNIDIHVPHHAAPSVPCYRLRAANAALRASAHGGFVREFPLTLGYVWRQMRDCHLWDPRTGGYVRFGAQRSHWRV